MGNPIYHHHLDSMASFSALKEAGAKGIEGFDALQGTLLIIVTTGKGIKCAPELVDTLHNLFFNGGDPPKDWEHIKVYHFNQSAADPSLKPFQERSIFPWSG